MSKKTLTTTLLAISFALLTQLATAQEFNIFGLTNQVWRYDSTNDWYGPTGLGWTELTFNDSAWPSGRAILTSDSNPAILPLRGTTIRDMRVVLPGVPNSTANQAVYFRTRFMWPSNAGPNVILRLAIRVDDGCAIYLNGHRVGGLRMGDPVMHNSFSTALVPCVDPSGNNDGTCDEIVMIDGTYLNNGENVLAVSAHSNNSTSSDVTWGCRLDGLIPAVPTIVNANEPTNRVVLQSRPTRLEVFANAFPPPTYQWYRNGTAIDPLINPTATNSAYVIDHMSAADAGDYYCEVVNSVGSATSRTATVGYIADTVAPLVVGVSSVSATEVGILFNEEMDSNTTAEAFGYTINGVQSVTNVILFPGNRGAVLQIDGTVPNSFTVGVTDARDYALNQVAAGTTVNGTKWADSADVGPPALAGHALSFDVGDADVIAGGADIWGSADEFHFVYNQQSGDFDVKVKVQRLDPSNNWAKAGLLARESLAGASRTIEAYTTPDRPPGTRSYEAGRRPEDAAATVDWGGRPPSPIPNAWVRLRRNGNTWRAYWGTNGTQWTLYAGPVTQVMTTDLLVGLATTSHNVSQTTLAEFRDLANFTYPGASLAFNPTPQSLTVQQNAPSATFAGVANASGAPQSEIHYQWQRSPDGTTWTNIPGANGTTISIKFPTGDDSGDSFRLSAAIPGATLTSPAASLTLTPDTVRPRLLSAVGVNATTAIAFFSEPMDATSLDQFAIRIDPGITVATAAVNPANPLRVDITVTPDATLVAGNTYTLSAEAFDNGGIFSGAVDRSLNPVTPNPASAQFVAQNFSGDPNSLVVLPTDTKRAIGLLTERGFNGRYSQVLAPVVNSLAVTEQMLAGTYIDPATGQPYPNIAPVPTFVETGVINYNNNAPLNSAADHLQPTPQFPGYTGPADMFCFEVLTYVELRSGIYRMGVSSDDGFRVTPATSVSDPNNSIVLGQFDGGRGIAETVFNFVVPEEGLYPMRLIWEEGGGDANVEWWIQKDNGSYVGVNGDDSIRAFRPPSTAVPTIALARGTGTITLSWTDAEGTFQLQSSPSLHVPDWQNVSGVNNVGANYSITVTVPGTGNRYYRLRKP